jgi:TrmH family RNA methyltransferase
MKTITSADNALYKSIKALNAAKGRREQGLFAAEGPHLAEEALRSRMQVRYVVVREDAEEKFADLMQRSARQGAEALLLPAKLFYALADTGTPQGILAVCEIRRHSLVDAALSGGRLAVILERVQDPGNLGTILRTALAVDAGFAVLTGDCADPWSQKAVRASQGAVFHLPVVECDRACDAVQELNRYGWHTACGHLGGSEFFQRQPHARTALVIGNEAAGISAETAAACGARYRLPMPGKAESLNAAVAAGIMLYDLWREQNPL